MNNDRKRIDFEDLVGVTVLAVEYTDEVIKLFTEDAEYDEIRALAEDVFGPEALTLPAAGLRCAGPDQ